MSGAADPSIDRWLAEAHKQVVVGEDDGARYGSAQPSPSGWGSPPPHADDRHQNPEPPKLSQLTTAQAIVDFATRGTSWTAAAWS